MPLAPKRVESVDGGDEAEEMDNEGGLRYLSKLGFKTHSTEKHV